MEEKVLGRNDRTVKSFVLNKFGKAVNSKAYNCWKNMLNRCLKPDARGHQSVVCDEWQTFSNFYAWYKEHYYDGAELDKDWLGYHCHVYSPETCVFMPKLLNRMLRDLPVGERQFPFRNGRYIACCSLGGIPQVLGSFTDYEDCVNAVVSARYSYSLGLADRLRIRGKYENRTYISEEAYNAVVTHSWA